MAFLGNLRVNLHVYFYSGLRAASTQQMDFLELILSPRFRLEGFSCRMRFLEWTLLGNGLKNTQDPAAISDK